MWNSLSPATARFRIVRPDRRPFRPIAFCGGEASDRHHRFEMLRQLPAGVSWSGPCRGSPRAGPGRPGESALRISPSAFGAAAMMRRSKAPWRCSSSSLLRKSRRNSISTSSRGSDFGSMALRSIADRGEGAPAIIGHDVLSLRHVSLMECSGSGDSPLPGPVLLVEAGHCCVSDDHVGDDRLDHDSVSLS